MKLDKLMEWKYFPFHFSLAAGVFFLGSIEAKSDSSVKNKLTGN